MTQALLIKTVINSKGKSYRLLKLLCAKSQYMKPLTHSWEVYMDSASSIFFTVLNMINTNFTTQTKQWYTYILASGC